MGTRTDPLHAQLGAVLRLLELPADWQAELAEMLSEDEGVVTLANRRARLTAERRRLKEAYLRGDFEEDEAQWAVCDLTNYKKEGIFALTENRAL